MRLRSILPAIARFVAPAIVAGHVVLAASTCPFCVMVKHDCRPAALVAVCCDSTNADTARAAVIVPAIRVAPPAVAVTANRPLPIAPAAAPLRTSGVPAPAIPPDLILLLANLRV